jgi:hypothetical protein
VAYWPAFGSLNHRRPAQSFPSLGSRDNWMRTVLGKGYFAVLRLYGPTEAAIDRSWKPGDIEPTP